MKAGLGMAWAMELDSWKNANVCWSSPILFLYIVRLELLIYLKSSGPSSFFFLAVQHVTGQRGCGDAPMTAIPTTSVTENLSAASLLAQRAFLWSH